MIPFFDRGLEKSARKPYIETNEDFAAPYLGLYKQTRLWHSLSLRGLFVVPFQPSSTQPKSSNLLVNPANFSLFEARKLAYAPFYQRRTSRTKQLKSDDAAHGTHSQGLLLHAPRPSPQGR